MREKEDGSNKRKREEESVPVPVAQTSTSSSSQANSLSIENYFNDYDLTSLVGIEQFLSALPVDTDALKKLLNTLYNGKTLPQYLRETNHQAVLYRIFQRVLIIKQWSYADASNLEYTQWAVICNQLDEFTKESKSKYKDLFCKQFYTDYAQDPRQSPLFLALHHNHELFLINMLMEYSESLSPATPESEKEEMLQYCEAIINEAMDENRYVIAGILVRTVGSPKCNVLDTPPFLPDLDNLIAAIPAEKQQMARKVTAVDTSTIPVDVKPLKGFCQNPFAYDVRVWLISALYTESTNTEFWENVCSKMDSLKESLDEQEWIPVWYLILEYTYKHKEDFKMPWQICSTHFQQQIDILRAGEASSDEVKILLNFGKNFNNKELRSLLKQWVISEKPTITPSEARWLVFFADSSTAPSTASASDNQTQVASIVAE